MHLHAKHACAEHPTQAGQSIKVNPVYQVKQHITSVHTYLYACTITDCYFLYTLYTHVQTKGIPLSSHFPLIAKMIWQQKQNVLLMST